MDWSVDNSQILFVGDSMIQSMNVSYVTNSGVNFGIAGDTINGVVKRLKDLSSVSRAKVIVVAVGINDIGQGAGKEKIIESYSKLFKLLKGRPIVLSGILPVDTLQTEKWNKYFSNQFISKINTALESMCKNNGSCLFTNPSIDLNEKNLNPDYHIGDGLHLNQVGYAIWVKYLKKGISDIAAFHAPDKNLDK